MNRIRNVLFMLVALCMMAPPLVSFAGTDEVTSEIRKVFRADKAEILINVMQFTDEESKAFWPVYDAYMGEMQKLGDRWFAIVDDYAANYRSMTDEHAKKMLQDYLKLQRDKIKVRKSYRGKFEKILPANKVVRFYQVENKIDAIASLSAAANIPLVK